MQIKWIEDLRALTIAPNLFKAAELRHSSHTAYSRRLKHLEDWAGVSLLDRSARSVTLNEVGLRFLAQAESALQLLEHSRMNLSKSQHLIKNKLIIASGRTLSQTVLPTILQKMRKSSDELAFNVMTTSLSYGAEMLKDRKADFLLCHSHPFLSESLKEDDFDYMVVSSDKLVAVSAPNASRNKPMYFLPTKENDPLTPYLAYAESMSMQRILRDRMPGICRAEKLTTIFEADLAEVIYRVTKLGFGLAWLPYSIIENDLKSGALIRASTAKTDINMEIYFCRLKHSTKNYAQHAWTSLK